MSNVDAAPELLAAALSSAPPLVEVDVEVDVVVLPELLELCATEVTPVDENVGELSLPQPSPRAAARARRRITPKGSAARRAMSRILAPTAHLAGNLAPCYCAFVQESPRFASQEQIVEAAGAPSPVVRRWVLGDLMPEPRRVGGGHAQGTKNLWPPWAVERARWIREQLAQGASLDHLAELVRHGLGVPSAPILEADDDGEIAHEASGESEASEASPTSMDETAPPEPPRIQLDSLNLLAAERRLCELALERAGSLIGAAALLGITRHALRRRMIKLRLADLGSRPES